MSGRGRAARPRPSTPDRRAISRVRPRDAGPPRPAWWKNRRRRDSKSWLLNMKASNPEIKPYLVDARLCMQSPELGAWMAEQLILSSWEAGALVFPDTRCSDLRRFPACGCATACCRWSTALRRNQANSSGSRNSTDNNGSNAAPRRPLQGAKAKGGFRPQARRHDLHRQQTFKSTLTPAPAASGQPRPKRMLEYGTGVGMQEVP